MLPIFRVPLCSLSADFAVRDTRRNAVGALSGWSRGVDEPSIEDRVGTHQLDVAPERCSQVVPEFAQVALCIAPNEDHVRAALADLLDEHTVVAEVIVSWVNGLGTADQ